jgi:hypothetical protein
MPGTSRFFAFFAAIVFLASCGGKGNEAATRAPVNRYLWAASLDTLSFLPLEAADPFSGVIVTGWGRVGGAPGLYRVTVYIQRNALDTDSIRVAAFRQTGGGSASLSAASIDQIEDAILLRARQLKSGSSGG